MTPRRNLLPCLVVFGIVGCGDGVKRDAVRYATETLCAKVNEMVWSDAREHSRRVNMRAQQTPDDPLNQRRVRYFDDPGGGVAHARDALLLCLTTRDEIPLSLVDESFQRIGVLIERYEEFATDTRVAAAVMSEMALLFSAARQREIE